MNHVSEEKESRIIRQTLGSMSVPGASLDLCSKAMMYKHNNPMNNIHEKNTELKVSTTNSDVKGTNLLNHSVKHTGKARRKELK